MKKALILLLLVALLLPLVSCGNGTGEETVQTTVPAATEAERETETVLKCTLSPVGFDTSAPVYTKFQRAYLADTVESATSYGNGKDELSRPAPITLRWNVDFEEGETLLRYFVVRIWTNGDKSDARSFLVGRSEREYRFENAFIGQRYYWDVTAVGEGGVTVKSDAGTFFTENKSFRFLSVDGVTNVRDLGGKKTEDGKRVRQGLLYRGGRFGKEGTEILITDEGIKTMLQTLGIRTEIDLRTKSETGSATRSALGDGVQYLWLPLNSSIDVTNATLRSDLKKIFAALANEDNYPIYYHCAAGADRTGLLSWLINGLCGVSEDDLLRDYLMTNFGDIGGDRTPSMIKNKYVTPLKNATGETYAKKVYNYLKDTVGIPAANLDAVIRILKATPSEAKNTMPTVPEGHTHTPESAYTPIEGATCSCPGIRVKYCAVCGDFIADTIEEVPIDPDAHRAEWTVTRQPTVTDQTDGSRNGTCAECGRLVEQTIRFTPDVAIFTDASAGAYQSGKNGVVDAMRGKHFYPTAGDSAGNDLLIEYSVFYNRTMLFFASDLGTYAVTRINTESLIYWSPSNDIPNSWCPYAGGFEGTGDNFKNPVSDDEVTTPSKIMEEGGDYADYPNIGGANRNAPEYGWHRIGIRIHEELTNATALKKDATAGATKAKYVLTLTVYFDGAVAYKLKTDVGEMPMRAPANLLFTATSDGKGGIVYADLDDDRYVVPLRLNATTAESGKKVYVATADAFVSCGKEFVLPVEKLATPTDSTLTFPTGAGFAAPIYYRLKTE